ncbi:hypothetical protein [Streptomyces sp. KL116D]|uniref:hypothetical protein n=1 Tax=Streptomyces sp. KL116D TaxID=3045152 RepID=UPI003556BA3E
MSGVPISVFFRTRTEPTCSSRGTDSSAICAMVAPSLRISPERVMFAVNPPSTEARWSATNAAFGAPTSSGGAACQPSGSEKEILTGNVAVMVDPILQMDFSSG